MTRKEQMQQCREKGLSYQQIGALFGCSRQRVHQILSGYQIAKKSLEHKKGWYNQLRLAVFVRDNGECQKCGSVEGIILHHIDGNNANNALDNLITVCNNCHLDIHRPKVVASK